VTSSGDFPVGSEFNKRLIASIDSVEKDRFCRERERENRDSEIAEGCLGIRPCWSFYYGHVVFVCVCVASSVWCY